MAANTRTKTIPATPGMSIASAKHGSEDKAYYARSKQCRHVQSAILILGEQDRRTRDQARRGEIVEEAAVGFELSTRRSEECLSQCG